MPGLLLHACCGPCATYTVKRLREEGLEPTAFWFNPNIHPFLEHQRRWDSMRLFAAKAKVPIIAAESYEVVDFLRRLAGREANRCQECYLFRLSRTAAHARQEGYSAFTTTLLISPYQKHELLREVGEAVAKEHGIEFYYEDLRPGFRESRQMAQELALYRQQYCGCLYSEWERYAKVKIS